MFGALGTEMSGVFTKRGWCSTRRRSGGSGTVVCGSGVVCGGGAVRDCVWLDGVVRGINVGGVRGGERDGQDYGSMVAQWIRCLTCNVEVEGSNPG